MSFTFTLPVEGNERLLGFPNMPQCGGARKLPCTVHCNGNFSWNGQLVVQKATHNALSAALIINTYPEGFGKRMMTENEDDTIVISDSLSAHNTAWARFLAASIHDPDVKFAPFFNADGYGSDNDSWGFWNGRSRRKVVNELFFNGNGHLIDNETLPFSKANNKSFDLKEAEGTKEETGETVWNIYTERNQLAFCPQIRISRIFGLWCRNAGYSFTNHLGDDLNATFLQSQKSLDATQAQFGIDTGLTITTHNGQTDLPYVHDGMVWLPYSGWWEFNMQCDLFRVVFQDTYPIETPDPTDTIKELKWPIKIVLYTGQEPSPEDLGKGQSENGSILYLTEIHNNESTVYFYNHKIRMEVADEGLKCAVVAQYDYYERQGYGGGYYSEYEYKYTIWQHVSDVDMTIAFRFISPDQQQTGLNIFRRQFRIAETLPEVKNSAFLKTMLETMGLCYFVSGKTKRVEIVPYAMLLNAKSLDLTDWELTRETEIQSPEETLQTFRLKPLKDEDYNKDLRLADTSGNHLPDAYANHEHLTLLTKTNTLYRALMQEHEDMNWVEAWEEYSGNPDKLETGSGDEQNREPGVSIPHQRFVGGGRIHPETDAATGETPQLMVADFTISSDLYNTGDKPSDIILTQYRGLRKRAYYSQNGHYVWNEVMLPVWNGEFSLTAKGENSLGEKYVKPVLELANHKTITYKLRLPANMMQPVEDLLRPSDLPPERQTRFIVIRNVKTVPKKITFQIDNDRDDTVLCQIEAVKVY